MSSPHTRLDASDLLHRGTEDHYEDTELYDFEYRDRIFDVAWYRNFAAHNASPGARILELGAGTGRVTLPLLSDGFEVVALDRKSSMLEALASRLRSESSTSRARCGPIVGDMRELPPDIGSFDLVIAPFNALMHLYTWSDLLSCFREVVRVLKPGGSFAFDVQIPDLEWLTLDPNMRHAVTPFVHPVTRERLVYSTNHTYDPRTQICHIRLFYDDAPPPGRKFRPPTQPRRLVHLAHRQIFPEEIRALTKFAGLELDGLTGDFSDQPLTANTESQVAVCTRPR